MVLLWWWCFCELRCSTTMDGAIDATSASVYWWCVAVLLYWWMTRRRQDGVADATPASTATTTPLSHSGTPYENGLFRMKLLLCRDFPHSPPKGFFLTKIFHPNIATSGEICVNTLKRDWSPSLGLRYVLLVVRCLLIEPFPESALNEQAGKMLLENYEEYARLARLYTGIHAHKHKNKSKTGAICESTTSLNAGQSNETVLSKNTALAPALSSTSTSTKVLGLHDQNAAPSDPAVGGASAAHKKDGLLAVKIPVEKKKIDARKKGLKRL